MPSLNVKTLLAGLLCVCLTTLNGAWAAGVSWEQVELGNIFDAGQPVRLAFTADADAVDWTVYDFWHAEVASGRTAVEGGKGEIRPDVAGVGYYLIHAKPSRDGKSLADAYTSFAVIRPHV